MCVKAVLYKDGAQEAARMVEARGGKWMSKT